MHIKINNIDDFNKYILKLPATAIVDIDKRILDWLAAGGKETDPYIKQQYRYVENLLNMRCRAGLKSYSKDYTRSENILSRKFITGIKEIGINLIVKYDDGSTATFNAIKLAMDWLCMSNDNFFSLYRFSYVPSLEIQNIARKELSH